MILADYIKKGDAAIDCTCGNGNDTLFLARSVGKRGRVFAFDIQEAAIRRTGALLSEHGITNVDLICDSHEHLAEYYFKTINQGHGIGQYKQRYRESSGSTGCNYFGNFSDHIYNDAFNNSLEYIACQHIDYINNSISEDTDLAVGQNPDSMNNNVDLDPCNIEHGNAKLPSVILYNLGYLPAGDHVITTMHETTINSIKSALHILAPYGIISIVAYPGHDEGLCEKQALDDFVRSLSNSIYETITITQSNRQGAPVQYLIRSRA